MACSTPSRAPSTSVPPESEDKRMAPSTSSVAPSTSSVAPSTSSAAPSTSITMALVSSSSRIFARTALMAPCTPIPPQFEWTRSISTPEEFTSFLKWARSAAMMADPDERRRLLVWAQSTSTLASVPGPEQHKRFLEFGHSSARIAAPCERKRLLKWTHSTSRIAAPDEHETWSLEEEILKSFETALIRSYTDIKQEPMIYTYEGKPGLYECRNALWIWPKLRNSRALPLSELDRGPRGVGEKIKETFLAEDMIEERPSINELGFVTIKLSGKWIAKSIHTMLKDGIDTWAPKLPVERVIVDYPLLDEEIHEDLFQQHSIRCTLMRILEYSKVDATIGHHIRDTVANKRSKSRDISRAQEVSNRWFSKEEITDVVIKGKVPLGKRDFGNAYNDLFALWYGLHVQRADWIIYLTPIRLQEYIERCFTAAKLENWIPSDRRKSTRTSYAGYRACTTILKDDLLDKARNCCVAVEKGEAAKLLGYTAEAILNCVFRYTFLTNHRLAVWTLDIDEMLKEEGNTFVYLLNTQAKIRRITDGSREDINELKKASELILGKAEELILGKDEERMLGVHLLEFTDTLKEACLTVMPHILCEYLYNLSEKFNSYYSSSSAFKAASVSETRSLLLCEATAVVMEKCFHLLGITPTSLFELSICQLPSSSLFSAAKRSMDVNARELPRNSRFELLSFRTAVTKHYGYGEEEDRLGKMFGLVSVSDKYGLVLDGGSHFSEPDFAHVPLFNHDWDSPINMVDWEMIYLGNSTSRLSVPFASSLEIHMELYVTKGKNTCYQLCNHKEEIDLSDFWNKESDSARGLLTIKGEDGPIYMHYFLLKDAVDAFLEVKFRTETLGRKVRGYVLAYYGDDFLHECHCSVGKDGYSALLFISDDVLKPGKLELIKSVMAVPTKGNLIIKAYLEDAGSGEVIMKNSCKFKPQLENCSSHGTISGIEEEDCNLDLTVDWKYQV